MENSAPQEVAKQKNIFDWKGYAVNILNESKGVPKATLAMMLDIYARNKEIETVYNTDFMTLSKQELERQKAMQASGVVLGMGVAINTFNPNFRPLLDTLNTVINPAEPSWKADFNTFLNDLRATPDA